jgi:hypothetical protein
MCISLVPGRGYIRGLRLLRERRGSCHRPLDIPWILQRATRLLGISVSPLRRLRPKSVLRIVSCRMLRDRWKSGSSGWTKIAVLPSISPCRHPCRAPPCICVLVIARIMIIWRLARVWCIRPLWIFRWIALGRVYRQRQRAEIRSSNGVRIVGRSCPNLKIFQLSDNVLGRGIIIILHPPSLVVVFLVLILITSFIGV